MTSGWPRYRLAAASLALLAACADSTPGPPPYVPSGRPPVTPEDGPAWVSGATAKSTYVVRWRPGGGTVPLNDYFELEVELLRAANGTPLEGAEVNVRADMPAHGHGMNVVPAVREVGGGRYRAEGMLLHMRGHWQIGVDVIVNGTAESASFDLDLG